MIATLDTTINTALNIIIDIALPATACIGTLLVGVSAVFRSRRH